MGLSTSFFHDRIIIIIVVCAVLLCVRAEPYLLVVATAYYSINRIRHDMCVSECVVCTHDSPYANRRAHLTK